MDDKKIFDVTPPKTPESIAAAKNARKIMLNDPQLKQDTSATPDIVQTPQLPEKPAVPHAELNIAPLVKETPPTTEFKIKDTSTESETAHVSEEVSEEPSSILESVEEPAVSPSEEEVPDVDVNKVEENEEQTKEVEKTVESKDRPEEKDEPIRESASVDSILPDDSQRASATAKDAMQSPTMYDTKAYFVPIGNSQHRHGHVFGAVIAGLFTAIIVAAIVFGIAKFL
jgi:hypothetical protein